MPTALPISIQKCSTFNLRGISLIIPRNDLTVISGPAGSGKSALLNFSLLAESSRRLELSFGQYGSSLTGDDGLELPHIDPAAPVVDLRPRLDSLAVSQITVGQFLEIDLALAALFANAAEMRCGDDGAIMIAMDAKGAAENAIRVGGPDRVILICGELQDPESVDSGTVERLAEAGINRLVIGGEYRRFGHSAAMLEAIRGVNYGRQKTLFAVIETISTGPADLNQADRELALSLSIAVERAAAGPFARVSILSMSKGEIDWRRRFDIRPGHYRCERCDKELALPEAAAGLAAIRSALSASRAELNVRGFGLNQILSSALATGSPLSALFGSLGPAELRLPRVRSAAALLPILSAARLSGPRVNQPITETSSGERLLLLLSSIAAARATGLMFLLPHAVGTLLEGDRKTLIELVGLITGGGNAVLLEERSIRPFAGSPGRYLQLGPGGGSRGGAVVAQGLLSAVAAVEKAGSRKSGSGSVGSGAILRIGSVEIPSGSLVQICGGIGAGKTALLRRLRSELGHRFRKSPKKAERKIEGGGLESAAANILSGIEIEWPANQAAGSVLFFDAEEAAGTARLISRLNLDQAIAGLYAETAEARRAGIAVEAFLFDSPVDRCGSCGGRSATVSSLGPFGRVRRRCPRCGGTGIAGRTLAVEYRGVEFREALSRELADLIDLFGSRRDIVERIKPVIDLGLGHHSLAADGGRFGRGDVVIFELIRIAAERSSARKRRKPPFILVDRPIFAADGSNNSRLRALLKSLVADGGIAIFSANEDAIEPDLVIDLGSEFGRCKN